MKTRDIIINLILTIFVTLSVTIIKDYVEIDQNILLLITFLIISLFWIGSYINDIDKISKKNFQDIKLLRKDLNIIDRLNKLESWKDSFTKMKRGQINIIDIIKIVAVLIVAYLLIKALGG